MGLPIIVKCYFANDESRELDAKAEALDMEFDIDMDTVYDLREVYFFNIDYIFTHPNGKDTMIGSGVEDFRAPVKLDKILKQLNEHDLR